MRTGHWWGAYQMRLSTLARMRLMLREQPDICRRLALSTRAWVGGFTYLFSASAGWQGRLPDATRLACTDNKWKGFGWWAGDSGGSCAASVPYCKHCEVITVFSETPTGVLAAPRNSLQKSALISCCKLMGNWEFNARCRVCIRHRCLWVSGFVSCLVLYCTAYISDRLGRAR